jgi:energy-converting hydrogenase Eha subunit B
VTASAFANRVRGTLLGTLVMAAALWGSAVGLLAARLSVFLGVACGCLTAAVVLWRGRHVWSIQRVALWVEEQVPALQYALVTAVDPQYAGRERVADVPMPSGPLYRHAIMRALAPPVVALIVAALLPPAGRMRHALTDRGAPADLGSRLAPLQVRVTPPGYAHVPPRTMADPTTIAGLVGSQVAVEGPRGWHSAFAMPSAPTVERLVDRQFTRVVVLQPILDAPPTVALTTPRRDSVVRAPVTGTLTLVADAWDDIGLSNGYFEYLITSGEEDAGGVKGREGRTRAVTFPDAKTGTLRAVLHLDSLGLAGGDLVSVRAVVFDDNTLSGPGKGVSETRSIRVLTRQAYDSLALEGAPPEGVDTVDKVEIGNRMYLRGRPPAIVVDVNAVRLRGTETPDVGIRTPGAALPTEWARFMAAVEVLRRSRAGVDSLAMMRVDAASPSLDSALDDALAALHAGTDATPALVRARRAILGPPTTSGALSVW